MWFSRQIRQQQTHEIGIAQFIVLFSAFWQFVWEKYHGKIGQLLNTVLLSIVIRDRTTTENIPEIERGQ